MRQIPNRNEQHDILQKSARLDWEINQFKLEAVVTQNRAIAPEPIRLLADESFSTPTYMGKRDAKVKRLKDLRATSPKENRARIDVVIELYASGKMQNYITAENMVKRLIDKTKRKEEIAKTNNVLRNWLTNTVLLIHSKTWASL